MGDFFAIMKGKSLTSSFERRGVMVWTNENTARILSTNSIVAIVCNGIGVDRISESAIRVLFDYSKYLVYTAELEKLAKDVKTNSKGSVFVIADSEKLGRGIIDIEFNPLRMPEVKTLGGAITKVCNFVESHYMPCGK